MKTKKPIRARTAVTLWLTGVMLLIWLIPMTAATIVTANHCESARDSDHFNFEGRRFWFSEEEAFRDDYWLYTVFDSAGKCGHNDLFPDTCQTAAILLDQQGEIVAQTGTFFYFNYLTEDSWKAGADYENDGTAQVMFDMELLSEQRRDTLKRDVGFQYYAMRFTGVMEENRMQASRIEYVDQNEFMEALYATEPDEVSGNQVTYSYVISQEVESLGLPWHTLYEDERASLENQVTIYTHTPRISIYDEGKSFRYDGAEYASLMDLLMHMDYSAYEGGHSGSYTPEGLWENLRLKARPVYDSGYYMDESSTIKYVLLTAIRYSPILTAIESLTKVYLWTFLGAAVLTLLLRRTMVRDLVVPIEAVNEAASNDWKYLIYYNDRGAVWRDAKDLERHYNEARDHRIKSNDEIFRLQAALGYAKTAEQNRRQMTSAIAHELKTPLAVIHSYAEGLKEHIAEDKRDRYLDVILSEAENLDAMVLEMLDLSRLEAGKVKLTRDEFSLSALTRNIFEKLDLAAQEKELQIELKLSGDCVITADEGRIGQVITNFAANAIKYTPHSGRIQVKVFDDWRHTWFYMENDSHPFSEEELSRIWDTFYRTDKARSGEGTGLGLAISKNIIELHGGHCRVQNTENGVEFSFQLKKS